jgi:hypothetical protein
MSGGLLQLVAKGPDNIYLEGHPEISFFKIIYRRHTNFSMYPKLLKFNKNMTFGGAGRCRIRRDGDLVTNLMLVVTVPKLLIEFIKLTKAILAKRLLQYNIIYDYTGSPDSLVTKLEYINVIQLINDFIGNPNIIGTLLFELDDNTANQTIIEDAFNDITITSGRNYADAVFQLIIINSPLEELYTFIAAYKEDRILMPTNLTNFDKVLTAVYNNLVSYVIGNDINFPFLKPNIIFYQTIDFANIMFNGSLSGTNIKFPFDDILTNTYGSSIDTNLDSYIVFNKYFKSLTSAQSTISSQSDIDLNTQKLLDNIEYNIRKNIIEIMNIVSILQQNTYDGPNQFRIGTYKAFHFVNSGQYDGTDEMNVVTVQSTDTRLTDYFTTALKIVPAASEPTNITHYFGNDVNTGAQSVYSSVRSLYRQVPSKEYFTDFVIWKKLLLSTILGPTYSPLDDIYVMNSIPYYAINDIPLMVNKYIQASPQYSGNSAYFDLTATTFPTMLKENIMPMYSNYTNAGAANDIKAYLTGLNDLRNPIDKLLVSLFKPEIILNIDTTVFSAEVITDANEKNSNLVSIEYVIASYAYKYRELIYNLTTDPTLRKQLVKFIITNIVNRFRMTNLPSYSAYKTNGYTLYNIESAVMGVSANEPEFVDAASSIWYALNQNMIPLFNNLFIGTLLSPSYYQTNLGENMTTALNYFDNMLTANGIQFDANFANFDFYRLRLTSAIFDALLNIYNNMYSSFNTLLALYKDQKPILTIKNAQFNRSKNYYRAFSDMFDTISNEILGNEAAYFPADYNEPTYQGINIPDTLDAIKLTLMAQGFIGAIDIENDVRSNLLTVVGSGGVNPFADGSSLSAWFNTYDAHGMIDEQILTNFDTVMDNTYDPPAPYKNVLPKLIGAINPDDTSVQFNDPNVVTLYSGFENDTWFLEYMGDKVLDNLDKFKQYIAGLDIDKDVVHDNFLNIVTLALEKINSTLAIIYNGNLDAVDKFTGSILEIELTTLVNGGQPLTAWIKELGHYLIEQIHVEIGGQVIDMHLSEWLRLFHKITLVSQKEDVYNKFIGNVPELYLYNNKPKDQYTMYIPLQFWFCRHIAESLPLIAMQYTDIDIILKIRNLDELIKYQTNTMFPKALNIIDCKILAEYMYVEQDERKRLAEKKHEYLIETAQSNGDVAFGIDNIVENTLTSRIYFSNQCKLLVWSLKFLLLENKAEEIFDWTNTNVVIDGVLIDPVISFKIKFNGSTREADKTSAYYRNVQSYHAKSGTLDGNEYMYSFAVDPLKIQPSGSVNLNQISDFVIIVTLHDKIVQLIDDNKMIIIWRTFNYSYNWLRIMSGMAGLTFFG